MSAAAKSEVQGQHHVETALDVPINPGSVSFQEEQDVQYKLGWRSALAITALALANCCAALTNTSNTTIRFQVASVGGANLASWIGNASFLLTLCFGPVFGFLGDRLGKKWFMVGGAAVGVVGACIAGTAHTAQRIVAGQVLSGVANAGCIVSVAASQEITPNKVRPWVMGYTQTLASSAALLGTYCAGAFVKYHTWRWSYYLNAFAYFIAGTSVALTYFPPPPTLRRQETLGNIFSGLDYIGIFLLSGSLASLVIGLTWGGTTYAWSSGQVVAATLVVGCLGLVGLAVFEMFVKTDGLLDHRLFANRNFPILLFVCTIDGMLLLGVNVLYAQEIASLFTTDAVRIAVILSPYLITSLFGCLPAGYLMARTKSYRTMLVAALIWCSLFTGLMALVTPNRLRWTYAFSTLFGIGTAVTTVIPVVALALSVPSFLLGTAGTLRISCRALGDIVGITIFTAIHSNKYAIGVRRKALLAKVLGALANPAVAPPVALEQIRPALSKATVGAVLEAVSHAQTEAWKWVWVAVSCLVAVNAVVACFANPVKERMNHHVESALEHSETRMSQMAVKKTAS
ncbi:major facilitator superfamily permease [Exophiala viscosa]|uniref:Major facilitator superfamily permease n=1 Tax=Exophiala viscosa TaxID=2486360 RepID=A0AAN6IDY2_9EURO|nr:major facilitator superfamily permease [Exophiala viscosa]KAI1622499.1 major facilitator superfamily permease [Exophiala viscosa]